MYGGVYAYNLPNLKHNNGKVRWPHDIRNWDTAAGCCRLIITLNRNQRQNLPCPT